MANDSPPRESAVAACSVPPAAGLRDWFRRAALCQASAKAAAAAPGLRDVQVALLHPAGTSGRRTLLHMAIDRLGAKAVSIDFDEEQEAVGSRDVSKMARVLGRLYDAVDCSNMQPAVVHSIARDAGVPVFGGLGCECHPVKALAELWTIEMAARADGRHICFIGDPEAEPAAAFMAAAANLGFGIEVHGKAGPRAPAPFTVDASDPRRWELSKGFARLGHAFRNDNRTCLIQALLLREILGR